MNIVGNTMRNERINETNLPESLRAGGSSFSGSASAPQEYHTVPLVVVTR